MRFLRPGLAELVGNVSDAAFCRWYYFDRILSVFSTTTHREFSEDLIKVSLLLATIASPVTNSLCTESGAYCVRPLTGNLCTDSPGFCDIIDKTALNISPPYQLDFFDWTVLIVYFGILTILAIE